MSVSKIICMKDEDFRTMATQGYVVIDGVQVNYSGSNLYFTDYMSADMVDDTNSAKKFLTQTQVTQLGQLPTVLSELTTLQNAINGKQDPLYDTGANKNFAKINGISLLAGIDANIDSLDVLTTAPTADNNNGLYKVVHLTSNPTNKYEGYIYLIEQS